MSAFKVAPSLCDDEGCPHHNTPHVCNPPSGEDNGYAIDTFDREAFPFGARAGSNKFGWTECPFCQSDGHEIGVGNERVRVFPFRDQLSAREYLISGLCQECQDRTFTCPED